MRTAVIGLIPMAAPWADPGLAQRAGRLRHGLALMAAVAYAVGVSVATGGAPVDPASAVAAPSVVEPGTCAPGWVTGWQAAAQPAVADLAFGGATLRMVVHPQVTGSQVRVRLSNAYGTTPLTIGTVSAGRSDGAAGLVGPARPVAFDGRPDVVIPPGGQILSDPLPLVAEVGTPLAVSMFVPVRPEIVSQHAVALQTSYLSHAGDLAFATDGAAFDTAVGSWMVLTGLDVLAPRPVNAVVAIGDSITDGIGSGQNADARWSDALASRLTQAGGAAGMAVLNAGISRNRLLADDPAADGDSPLTRFDRDVAAAAGATDVVLHIGTNDIAAGRGADEIVAGMLRFVGRAHVAGKRVFLTTITPSHTGAHGTAAAIATRDAVNAWVLAHGRENADGVFDFAAAVADPVAPSRLAPAFDSGDGLHLSAAGYRALADTVDVGGLTGSPCLADTSPARVVVSGR